MQAWYRNIVLSNPLQYRAIRSPHAFVIAHLEALPWTATELEVAVLATCSELGCPIWEVLGLLNETQEWGRQRNAVRWHLWSDTSFDLGPLAKRLGCQRASSRYIRDLRSGLCREV